MSRNRNLTDLKNIGKTIAGRLNEVGIVSEDDLKLVGFVSAHRLIKERHPSETLAVCYYLYSFEGALTDMHWNELDIKKKTATQRASRLTSHCTRP
jgi:DNA transformation protein